MPYAKIAIPLPLEDTYDYFIPPHLESKVHVGMKVRVPFGKRMLTGFCVEITSRSEVTPEKLKEVQGVLTDVAVVDLKMLEFSRWWSRYYHCSLGEALDAAVPSEVGRLPLHQTLYVKLGPEKEVREHLEKVAEKHPAQAKVLRFLLECDGPIARERVRDKLKISLSPLETLAKKGIVSFFAQSDDIDPFAHLTCAKTPPPTLTPCQGEILSAIEKSIELGQFESCLLFGITGSGKTEVYIRSIQKAVEKGKQAIVLVPEIALTPQTVIRFKERFDHVAVLHSELTPAQRASQWKQIHEGKVQVVIGPRSAIFAPTHKLGLVVVDEEHEPSFKQQNTPRYNARDLAVKRAQIHDAVVILGSATPSLESFYNCARKKYKFFHLPVRIGKSSLPKLVVVDMKEEYQEQKKFVYFSRMMIKALRNTLSAGEQAIVFLNRRGFATAVTCPACGYEMKCAHCEVVLTYHKKSQVGLCHYCGEEIKAPESCPICQFHGIRFFGAGTERIESLLQKEFPQARVVRMDSDTMTTRDRYERTFLSFSRGEIDILLGTQMIAKGLDFPKVTMVGIVSADSGLQLPDFRCAERTFQLTVQVAGRAGRGEKPGLVIVQTLRPDHYAIQTALAQDYQRFANKELLLRKSLGYPPFGKLLRIVVEGADEEPVKKKAQEVRDSIVAPRLDVLGPAPAPIPKLKDRFRWHLIVKSSDFSSIEACGKQIKPHLSGTAAVRVQVDVDPISML